jgi:hypothetical protein
MVQPDRDPSTRDLTTRREEAMARIAVTTEALRGLEEALQAEPGLPESTAQALLSGARALCPVAASTGTELALSAGPDHRWTVFVRSDTSGPQLRVRRLRLDAGTGAPTTAPTPVTDIAAQLADLLRTDPLDTSALH